MILAERAGSGAGEEARRRVSRSRRSGANPAVAGSVVVELINDSF